MNKKVVYVEWLDSFGCTSSWQSLEDYSPVAPIMKTIGFIVYESKDLLSLANSIGDETEYTLEQANGIMTIPKNCIVQLKKIAI